jgi:hypothetical protein
MLKPKDDNETKASADVIEQAVNRFLGALSAWGPTHALREKIRFQQFFADQQQKKLRTNSSVSNAAVERVEGALQRRLTQSAACYLELPSALPTQFKNQTSTISVTNGASTVVDSSSDSLFLLKDFLSIVSSRVSIIRYDQSGEKELTSEISPSLLNTKVALDSLAELNVMMTKYDIALSCYLAIGSLFSPEPLSVLEKQAVDVVNHGESIDRKDKTKVNSYGFVLAMVEHHHLHGSLLDSELLDMRKDEKNLSPPLISLVRLLGLEIVGDFLVDHCVPPPGRSKHGSTGSGSLSVNSGESSEVSRATREGEETLPINYVAEQLQSSPSLLHWYLHLIFTRKPEMYVQFATTAVLPRSVTELHRAHLQLYVDFTEDRDSALSLIGTEVYNQERKTTPLLLFLKAALPLGGIRPSEVRKLLETKRSESVEDVAEFPHSFALELAHVIENHGDGSEEDSQQVLDLYLKGTRSVMLAAAYAQRSGEHATVLWETLIQYCLAGEPEEIEESKVDGTLFGSLLEAAALCGADLALLVTSIPQGLNIEGLRPRLVAAVADYRMKLTMHEAAADICMKDRISLLRELGHRSRRGVRQCNTSATLDYTAAETTKPADLSSVGNDQTKESLKETLRRPTERPSRYRLSVRLPMR